MTTAPFLALWISAAELPLGPRGGGGLLYFNLYFCALPTNFFYLLPQFLPQTDADSRKFGEKYTPSLFGIFRQPAVEKLRSLDTQLNKKR